MLNKKQKLNQVLIDCLKEGLILALSGGVDSALLLAVIATIDQDLRKNFLAITFDTILYPKEEIEIARSLCNKYQMKHCLVHPKQEIASEIIHNPKNRCYLCKKNLFFQVVDLSRKEGYKHIIDGTNADDLKVYRPGKKALEELGVKSPLADCGFSKAEVRAYAEELGLEIANKPSGSCYATRFPYGAELNQKVILKISELENYIKNFGISQIRVRYHQPIIRLELLPEEFDIFLRYREDALKKAEELGFSYLTLDMAGFRSGSMDIDLLADGNNLW